MVALVTASPMAWCGHAPWRYDHLWAPNDGAACVCVRGRKTWQAIDLIWSDPSPELFTRWDYNHGSARARRAYRFSLPRSSSNIYSNYARKISHCSHLTVPPIHHKPSAVYLTWRPVSIHNNCEPHGEILFITKKYYLYNILRVYINIINQTQSKAMI